MTDPADGGPVRMVGESFNSVEYLLFDSLVHRLIEKGLLTKNDALSVVQIAAEVVRGRIHESGAAAAPFEAALATLERTYSSFEALADRQGAARLDGHNVHPLRAPLHGERPRFPSDDN
ncbi:MAG TPA: hypothetical protein VFW35_07925 [Sphingomicrobium sp.]|nr:hypothetical protein [Sphingomicrobium sp.]